MKTKLFIRFNFKGTVDTTKDEENIPFHYEVIKGEICITCEDSRMTAIDYLFMRTLAEEDIKSKQSNKK